MQESDIVFDIRFREVSDREDGNQEAVINSHPRFYSPFRKGLETNVLIKALYIIII